MRVRATFRRRFPLVLLLFSCSPALAAVTGVTITARTVVGDGAAFGASGSYEYLVGTIAFAIDPADPANGAIVDLEHAPRGTDGLVHFTSDLRVLRPTDPAKGNGVLLFDIANRGLAEAVLALFNARAPRREIEDGDVGDGLLMRDGYTVVSVGWEFDVPANRLRMQAPVANLPQDETVAPISVDVMVNERTPETVLVDEPVRPPAPYPPADPPSATDILSVRDRFWDKAMQIPQQNWRFLAGPNGIPRLGLDGGFDPGRWYRITYRATNPVVAGLGFAAIRDAAAAFRYRSDLPVRGRAAYAFGQSQTGRWARQFLYEGFNVDERGRRVFDAVWSHKAGAARGSFNRRFAIPAHGDMFESTQFPFADDDETDTDGSRDGLQSRYSPSQRPKVFYTNTPVEYWAGGRAAALLHTSVSADRDLEVAGNVRIYLLAGTQHIVPPFPPAAGTSPGAAGRPDGAAARNDGQLPPNPTPHANVMRALLRALHEWTASGTAPPASSYPRLADDTLVPIENVSFPRLRGVADPRRITGPGRMIGGAMVPLPHLVPEVDADGNDIAGVHDPEAAVPLATTTGWNFRAERVGNPGEIYQTLGSYIPFARTRAEREAASDPRLSLEERYDGRADYLERVRSAAMSLVSRRLMLAEDVDRALERARAHWEFAMRE
jgi:hypothetical protein